MGKLGLVFAAILSPIMTSMSATAQEWPRQPIHFIVAFGAGGGADRPGIREHNRG